MTVVIYDLNRPTIESVNMDTSRYAKGCSPARQYIFHAVVYNYEISHSFLYQIVPVLDPNISSRRWNFVVN